MHGLTESANGSKAQTFLRIVREHLGAYAVSCEVGNGGDSTLIMTVAQQVAELRRCVADDPLLKNGFIGVGYSNGGYLMRALLQEFQNKEIKMVRLVTLHSPLGGFFCGKDSPCNDVPLPEWVVDLAGDLLYSDFIQQLVGATNYWRDPERLDLYLAHARSLPELDNLRNYSEVRKQNYLSIDMHVAFAGPNDISITPWCSGHFCTWADDDSSTTPLKDRDVYEQDLFGARTMFESGRLLLIEDDRTHFNAVEEQFIIDHVLQYLKRDE